MAADDAFGPALPTDVRFVDMLACVDRELVMRRKTYPRWVAQGKLTQDAASQEITRLEAVRLCVLKYQAALLATSARAGGITNPAAWEAMANDFLADLKVKYPGVHA